MIIQPVMQDIEHRIQLGLQPITGKTILHTAPHHDDILLGYFPYFLHNLAGNKHHVLYMTSGANGVSDTYLAQHLGISNEKVQALDHEQKQALKFAIREAESEKKWSLFPTAEIQVKHVRADFYAAEMKQESIDALMAKDIARVADYLAAVRPDIITILVEEPGVGPTSHHISEMILTAAIAQCDFLHDVTILGYRNVWSSFSLDQASIIYPVPQHELDVMQSIFTQCFVTQQTTRFMPLFDENYDNLGGDTMLQTLNFAQEAAAIQQAQLHQVMQALGTQHPLTHAMMQQYQGALYLQKL